MAAGEHRGTDRSLGRRQARAHGRPATLAGPAFGRALHGGMRWMPRFIGLGFARRRHSQPRPLRTRVQGRPGGAGGGGRPPPRATRRSAGRPGADPQQPGVTGQQRGAQLACQVRRPPLHPPQHGDDQGRCSADGIGQQRLMAGWARKNPTIRTTSVRQPASASMSAVVFHAGLGCTADRAAMTGRPPAPSTTVQSGACHRACQLRGERRAVRSIREGAHQPQREADCGVHVGAGAAPRAGR